MGLHLTSGSMRHQEEKMSESNNLETALSERTEPELRKKLILAIAAAKAVYREASEKVEQTYKCVRSEYSVVTTAWEHQLPNINRYRRMTGMDRRNFLSARENFAIGKTELVREVGALHIDYGLANEILSPEFEGYKNHKGDRHPLHLLQIVEEISALCVIANQPFVLLYEAVQMDQRIKEMSSILQQTPKWGDSK